MGTVCTIVTDIKVIIAYSSVAHIGLALASLFVLSKLRVIAGLTMFITHAASSSFIFMQRYFIYLRSRTRRVLVNKTASHWSRGFAVSWFAACIGIIGAPPTANIIAEITTFIRVIKFCPGAVIPLAIGALLAGAYSLALFSFILHGNLENQSFKKIPLTQLEFASAALHIF